MFLRIINYFDYIYFHLIVFIINDDDSASRPMMKVRAEYGQSQVHVSQGSRTCSLLVRVYYDVT